MIFRNPFVSVSLSALLLCAPVAMRAQVPSISLAPTASPPATESTTVSSERIRRSIDTPGGEGDPDAISCRLPQQRADSRLPGPEICKRNRDWASLKNAGYDISPDGKSAVPTRQAGTNCTKSTAGSMYIGYITQDLCK